jgi:hypothetical protein
MLIPERICRVEYRLQAQLHVPFSDRKHVPALRNAISTLHNWMRASRHLPKTPIFPYFGIYKSKVALATRSKLAVIYRGFLMVGAQGLEPWTR